MADREGMVESPATRSLLLKQKQLWTAHLIMKTLFCGGHMPTEKMIGREQMMEE